MDHDTSSRVTARALDGARAAAAVDPSHTAHADRLPGASTPPMHRGSMVARPWRGLLRGLADGAKARLLAAATWLLGGGAASSAGRAAPAFAPLAWQRAAARRRRTLLALVLASAAGSTYMMTRVLPADGSWLRVAQIALFALLFAWVAAGFFTALMGFLVLWRGDRHALSAASAGTLPIGAEARTAIIMPICNEEVATVFAGLRATCESLAATGQDAAFDVFVLSDTSDPALRAAELAAWAQLRAQSRGAARIYYRWRQRRTRRKAGNVADFCRRWGRDYRYMVVLDADSVMSGDCLVQLVRLMEAHPDAGILQTAPHPCGLDTVHARAQQFTSRVAGRLFTAGMQYWQLGESHYWGHNAIIRTAAFMQHCGLASLPGRGGLSGEILSHDFVEAALMRRAGYHVWLVQDLHGSFEQPPPNLLEELQRDRRWCQGNLQNARLMAEPGLHAVHRAMLATGAFSYLSAPLWLAFVLLGAISWLGGGEGPFLLTRGLHAQAFALWATTATMLVLPRLLGVAAIALRQEQASYGGAAALLRGCVLEFGLSILQAPVRMVAHTLFVVVALTGLKLTWKSPPRVANDIGWGDAAARFSKTVGSVAVLVGAAYALRPEVSLWLAPTALPLLLAVPLAVYTSRSTLGRRLMRHDLLLTPEESSEPAVLRAAGHYARQAAPAPAWRDVLADPWLFGVVRAAMGPRNTSWGSRGKARRRLLQGLQAGHDAERLANGERMRLMSEPQSITRLRDQLATRAEFA